jgi:hypothetical protein
VAVLADGDVDHAFEHPHLPVLSGAPFGRQ